MKLFKPLCIIFNLMCVCIALYAQEKSPLASAKPVSAMEIRKTYAIIIGVGKFKNPSKFQPLNYAGSDAAAFQKFLLNQKEKLNIDTDQIRMYLDTNATQSNIRGAFHWVAEHLKPNDQVIFYFSGHGGADQDKPFLVLGDNMGEEYLRAGIFTFDDIVEILNRYVAEGGTGYKNIKRAVVILDACSSGSFEDIGSGFNNSKFLRMYSCYSNSESVEVERYRSGLFTHYLLSGLKGDADMNQDTVVSVPELTQYMRDSVWLAHGEKQSPQIMGGSTSSGPIFAYNYDAFKVEQALEKQKSTGNKNISKRKVTPKGIVDKSNLIADGDQIEDYKKFNDYIKQNHLLFGKETSDTIHCANFYYMKLAANPAARERTTDAKLTFLNALQRKNSAIFENFIRQNSPFIDYQTNKEASKEMTFALTLVDSDDPFFQYLKPRSLFMQSLAISDPRKAIAILQQAVQFDPKADYALVSIANRLTDIGQLDSALTFLNRAMITSPKWPLVYVLKGFVSSRQGNFGEAETYYKKALDLNPDNAHSNYAYGAASYNNQHYDQAIESLKKALKISPNNVTYIEILAKAYYAIVDNNKAIYYYNKLLKLNPKNNDARIQMAKIQMSTQDFEAASAQIKTVVAKDSSNANNYVYLANTQAKSKKYEDALTNYRNALNLDPRNQEAINGIAKLPFSELDYLQTTFAGSTSISKELNKLTNAGIYAFSLRKDSVALKFFSEVLAIDSVNPIALDLTGLILQSRSQFQLSVSYYQKLTKLFPKNAIYEFTLANLYTNLKKDELAMAAIRTGLKKDSTNAEQWENLGILEYKTADFKSALASFSHANELTDGQFSTYTYNAGIAAKNLQRNDLAISFLLKSIKKDPKNLAGYKVIGDSYLKNKEYNKTILYLNQAKEIEPKDADVWANLGESYLGLKQYQNAQLSFEKALELDAKNVQRLADVARALTESGDTVRAIKLYNQGLMQAPNDASLSYNLAWLYNEKHQNAEAIIEYQRTIKSDSTYVDAYTDLADLYVTKYEDSPNNDPNDLADVKKISVPLYKAALKIDSNNMRTLLGLSRVYWIINDQKKREIYALKALQTDSTNAWPLSELAILRNGQGRTEDAISLYKRAIRSDSTDVTYQYDLGQIYLDINRPDSAAVLFNNAFKINPNYGDFDLYYGKYCLAKLKYNEALAHFEKYKAKYPEYSPVNENIADVYYANDNFKTALKLYNSSLQKDASSTDAALGLANSYLSAKSYKAAIIQYRKVEIMSQSPHDYDRSIASAYAGMANYTTAIRLMNDALKASNDTDYLIYLADLYVTSGQFDKAISILEKGAKDAKKTSECLIKIGELYQNRKNFEKAKEYFKRVIAINPLTAYVYLGNLYFDTDKVKSQSYYRLAIKADSTSSTPYYNLASVAKKAQKYNEALDLLRIARMKDSTDLSIYEKESSIYQSLKDTTASIKALQMVVAKDGNYQNQLKLAETLYNFDRYDQALTSFLSAQQLNPEALNEYSYELGECYHTLGKYKNAIIWYNKAVILNPKDGIAYNNLAMCHFLEGNDSAAETILNNLLKSAIANHFTYYALLKIYAHQKRIDDAIRLVVTSRKHGVSLKEDFTEADSDLKNLQESSRFMKIIAAQK